MADGCKHYGSCGCHWSKSGCSWVNEAWARRPCDEWKDNDSNCRPYVTHLTETKAQWTSFWKKLGPFIGLIFVFCLFSVLRFHTFLSIGNVQLILMLTAVVGTAALGMTIIIIAGGIDLSVGFGGQRLSTIADGLLLNAGVPQIFAASGGAAVGVAGGFVTGNLIIGQVGRVTSVVLAVGACAILNHVMFLPWILWGSAIGMLVIGLVVNEVFLKHREFNSAAGGLIPFIATLGMMGARCGWGALAGG